MFVQSGTTMGRSRHNHNKDNYNWNYRVICLAVSVHGWHLKGKAHVISRVVLFITALLMIDSGLKTDLIGVVLIIIVYLFEKFRLRKMIKQDETVSLDEESVNTNL